MANKFQSAIPGALIETDSHLLVPAPAFSAVELIAGLMLMAGLLKHSGRGGFKVEAKNREDFDTEQGGKAEQNRAILQRN